MLAQRWKSSSRRDKFVDGLFGIGEPGVSPLPGLCFHNVRLPRREVVGYDLPSLRESQVQAIRPPTTIQQVVGNVAKLDACLELNSMGPVTKMEHSNYSTFFVSKK
jgi:hypothetical protein